MVDRSDGRRVRTEAAVGSLAALVAAAAINVPQFVALELLTVDEWDAVAVKAGHEPAALAAEHFDATRTDVGLFVEVRAAAPDATWVVPADAPALPDRDLVGLALASDVRRPPGPPTMLDDARVAALGGEVVAAGDDGLLGPWVLVLGDGEVDRLVVVATPGGHAVVDGRLLDEAAGS